MNIDSKEEKEINSRFFNYFIKKIDEEEKEFSQDDCYSFFSSSSHLNSNTVSSLNDNEGMEIFSNDLFFEPFERSLLKNKNISKIFEVIYPKKGSLFTIIENDLSAEVEKFCQKKRYLEKRRRFENHDNIRKKIKRAFFNKGIIEKMNTILKNNGSDSIFEKFQQHFVSNVTKKTIKQLLNMTLEQIFKKKELYNASELKYYYHNLNLVKSMEIQENKELKNILNKKYYQIYEEYLNSKEFLIDEINRLTNKNMGKDYIERYKYLAKNFIEFALD
jgi:hypothetical protein